MNLKLTHLSKIFITTKANSPSETIAIKTKNFKRFKTFALTSSLALAVMVWIIADLSQKNKAQEAERALLMAQINTLSQQVDKASLALDSVANKQLSSDEKAMTYIGAIEKKLTTINNYLSKRGLRGFSFKKVKTTRDTKVAAEKIFSKYDNYLSRLVNNVSLMPMGYPRISAFTSLFGHRGNPFGFGNREFHPGIDFRGNVGDPVKCTAAGKVEFAGNAGGYGKCVRIKHINGIITLYGHLSKISVREGQQVNVGQLIGKVGSTGRSTAAHLHYEVRRNGKAVNPKEYLSLN